MNATLIILKPQGALIDVEETDARAISNACGVLAHCGPIMPMTVIGSNGESIFIVRPISMIELIRRATFSERGGVS